MTTSLRPSTSVVIACPENLQRVAILHTAVTYIIMTALCNRCGHYIFTVVLSFFFFSWPSLNSHRLDVYHTSTPGVTLVGI